MAMPDETLDGWCRRMHDLDDADAARAAELSARETLVGRTMYTLTNTMGSLPMTTAAAASSAVEVALKSSIDAITESVRSQLTDVLQRTCAAAATAHSQAVEMARALPQPVVSAPIDTAPIAIALERALSAMPPPQVSVSVDMRPLAESVTMLSSVVASSLASVAAALNRRPSRTMTISRDGAGNLTQAKIQDA